MKTFFGENRRASVQLANGEYYVWFTQQNLELRGKDYRMEIHRAYENAVEAAKRFCAKNRARTGPAIETTHALIREGEHAHA